MLFQNPDWHWSCTFLRVHSINDHQISFGESVPLPEDEQGLHRVQLVVVSGESVLVRQQMGSILTSIKLLHVLKSFVYIFFSSFASCYRAEIHCEIGAVKIDANHYGEKFVASTFQINSASSQ
jgi:hypothetical protein